MSGEGGIRTHAPFRTNGFQDRLVMTASISLQTCFSIIQDKKRFVKSFFNLFFLVFSYFVAVHQQLSYNIMAGSICQHFFYIFSTLFNQISVVCQKNPPHSEADLSYHYFPFASSIILHFFTYFLHYLRYRYNILIFNAPISK